MTVIHEHDDDSRDPERPGYWLEEVFNRHVPENDLEMALEDLGMAVFAAQAERDLEAIRERVKVEAAAVAQDMSEPGDATRVILEKELAAIVERNESDLETLRMQMASRRERLEDNPRAPAVRKKRTRRGDLRASERMAARDKS